MAGALQIHPPSKVSQSESFSAEVKAARNQMVSFTASADSTAIEGNRLRFYDNHASARSGVNMRIDKEAINE
jgi:hypothetical protein